VWSELLLFKIYIQYTMKMNGETFMLLIIQIHKHVRIFLKLLGFYSQPTNRVSPTTYPEISIDTALERIDSTKAVEYQFYPSY
jgi:hypothetical protein